MTKRISVSQHPPNLGRVGGDVLVQFEDRRKIHIRQAVVLGLIALFAVAVIAWMLVVTSGNKAESTTETPLHLEHIANDTGFATTNLDKLKNLKYSNIPIMRKRAISKIERAAEYDLEGVFTRTRNRRDLKLEVLQRSYRKAIAEISDHSARNDLYDRYRAGRNAAEEEFRMVRSRATALIFKKAKDLKATVTTPPESLDR
ncbi:MAG: hypothetical protein AAF764_08130 [Pseudomonadota bacterium]